MQQVGARPGHAVKGQHAQRPPRHVHPVAHGVGAKQAAILFGAEDVDKGADLQRIDVLGVERDARLGQVRAQALIDGFQAADGGEQAQAPAARRQEQFAHGRRDLARVVLHQVVDDDDAAVGGVVEGAVHLQRPRRFDQAGRAAAHPGQRKRVLGRRVRQGGGGDQHAMSRHDDGGFQRHGRVDPVAAQGHVVDTAKGGLGAEPVHKVGIGFVAALFERRQHGAPARQGHARASVHAAQGALDPGARGAVQLGGLLVQNVLEVARQGQQRRLDGGDGAGGGAGGLQHRLGGGAQGALQPELGPAGFLTAGAQLFQGGDQEGLDRADGIDLARRRGDAARDALARQGGGGAHGVLQGLGGGLVVGAQVAQTLFQPAPATAAPFRAAYPAAQLGGFLTRKGGGEGAVGGVEEVVALVEDDAFQRRRLAVLLLAARRAGAVEGGLGHDQGVVGHDQIGPAAGANGLLDEAQTIVGTGGVDAFAAPVDQVGRAGLMAGGGGEQAGQPAGIVAPRHVAVAAVRGPAAGQPHADQVAVAQLSRLHHVLKIEQAKVVFTALAHHRLLAALGLVGPQGAAFAVDLALQGAGIGRDPGRARIALGPQAGGGQIAQGLAGAGAGLGQQDARAALLVAGGKGVGGLGGVVGLGGAGLVQTRGLKQFVQTDAGAFRIDGGRPGLTARGLVLPLLKTGPDVQTRAALAPVAQGSGLKRGQHPRAPGPARPVQGRGQGEGVLAPRIGGVGQFVEQVGGGVAQGLGLRLGPLGFGAAQGERQPRRRGRAELGGTDKSVELQHVQHVGGARRRAEAQAARGQAGVGDHDGAAQKHAFSRAAPDLPGARRVAHGARARRGGQRRRQLGPRLSRGLDGGGSGDVGHARSIAPCAAKRNGNVRPSRQRPKSGPGCARQEDRPCRPAASPPTA
ncbi:hypothetical protein D3C87_922610 [compost metagenome]